MDTQNKLEQVTQVLRDRGYTDEKIKEFFTNLYEMGWQYIDSKMQEVLTEEDNTHLNNVPSQDDANAYLRKVYLEKTGKDVSTEMQEFYDRFADGFLAGNDYKSAVENALEK